MLMSYQPKEKQEVSHPIQRHTILYNYGKIHFICLDSHDLSRLQNAEMAQWLIEDLKLANKTSNWLVAFWHHPPYTKENHDSDKEI